MSRLVWQNLKLNSIHRMLYEDCHNTKQASTQCISPLILNFQVHPPVKWTFVMDTIVFSVFTLCAIALWLNDNQNWASSLIFLIVLLQLPTTIRVSKFVVENVFNNSHIEYNNECDNNNNINDNEIFKKKYFFILKIFLWICLA